MPGRFDVSDYVDVQQRITRFWAEYPQGRINTDLMSLPDEFERVVFKASIYKDRECLEPDATGWAAEVAGGGGANQTSWHENGETSAIGRALANMGYATSGKDRPSREEMAKANRGPARAAAQPANGQLRQIPSQEPARLPVATEKQIAFMWVLAKQNGLDDAAVHGEIKVLYGKESVKDLTRADISEYIEQLQHDAQDRPQPIEQEPQKGFMGGSGIEEPEWMRAGSGLDAHTR